MKIFITFCHFFLVLSLAWWGAGTALADGPQTDRIHIVQAGEFLTGIAARYQLPLPALIEYNQLETPDFIYPGQWLRLPDEEILLTDYTIHAVQPKETLSEIAVGYGLDLTVLQTHNVIGKPQSLAVGQRLYIPRLLTTTMPLTVTPVITQRIVVDLSEQRAYVYEGTQQVYEFVVSTGIAGRETAAGTYQIQNKLPLAYASTWDLQMPYWLGFYWAGRLQNGFHALPIMANGKQLWSGALGRPASYGCVILAPADAELLFDWAEIGAEVIIQP